MTRSPRTLLLLILCLPGLLACGDASPDPERPLSRATSHATSPATPAASCTLVEEGFGPAGTMAVNAETVVSGLEVPWGLAFLDGGDLLVTERPGRLRLIRDGALVEAPVATIATTATGEGGLLGLAAHPDVAANGYLYLYYTTTRDGTPINRVERWRLSDDRLRATRDRVIVDDIPAATFHNGGRLHIGPDGMLYIGTGDARNPDLAQDRSSLAGKVLRVTPEGEVPADNPFPGSPVWLTGIRNTQGFDWPDAATLWLADHGPSGELGRTGHDEVNVAAAGDNLGWPVLYGCAEREGMVTPVLTWDEAVPPGGAAIYRGDAIPAWRGSLILGTLGSRHLHRVVFDPEAPGGLERHAVYLRGDQPAGYGRLRTVAMGPDGALYVTTSNCDGRGTCPPKMDQILRIVP